MYENYATEITKTQYYTVQDLIDALQAVEDKTALVGYPGDTESEVECVLLQKVGMSYIRTPNRGITIEAVPSVITGITPMLVEPYSGQAENPTGSYGNVDPSKAEPRDVFMLNMKPDTYFIKAREDHYASLQGTT